MKKVAIIILNYKTKDLTVRCLGSVKKSIYKNIQIIIIDNNSQDGIEEDLKKENNLVFIQSEKNLGYSGGNNLGIKQALSDKADFIFILNPDTTIEKDTITKLTEACDKHSIGIVGPKIYFNNSKVIWFAGGRFDLANVLGTHIGVDEKDMSQYDQEREVDFITGAALFVKREVFEKIGLFDERYFLYYEDSDFCFRAKNAGFKIIYTPEAIIYHENARSTGLGSPLQDYYITRNRLLFASKFLSLRTKFALLREVMRNFGVSMRRKALFDFLTRRFGQGNI